jgi:DNA-binding IclR family transcriptional regulator
MDVLEYLQLQAGRPVSVSALSRAIGVNKATCHTVLRMLGLRGYVIQDPETRQFRVGPALLGLAVALARHLNIEEEVQRHLSPLCREHGASGAFHRYLGDGTVQRMGTIRGSIEVEYARPEDVPLPFPTSLVHVFLAWGDPIEAQRIYATWSPPADAPPFLASWDAYAAELAAIRRHGYAEISLPIPGREILNAVTVAAVFDANRRPLLALSLADPTSAHAPVYRYHGEPLRAAAEAVTRAIGGRLPEDYWGDGRPERILAPAGVET